MPLKPVVMKSIAYLIGCLLCVQLSGQSVQNMETNPPFRYLGSTTEQERGVCLVLRVDSVASQVTFKKLFFRGRWAALTTEAGHPEWKLQAVYPDGRKQISMHADPRQEVGNQPPYLVLKENVPSGFDLNKGEAVLQYSWRGVDYYHIIRDLDS